VQISPAHLPFFVEDFGSGFGVVEVARRAPGAFDEGLILELGCGEIGWASRKESLLEPNESTKE